MFHRPRQIFGVAVCLYPGSTGHVSESPENGDHGQPKNNQTGCYGGGYGAPPA
jgi:hypothetical protein